MGETAKYDDEKIGKISIADDVVASTGMDNVKAAKFVDEKRYTAISEKKDFTFDRKRKQ